MRGICRGCLSRLSIIAVKIKLYRGIQLVNPEDFDPTEVGQSWTLLKVRQFPFFGFQKILLSQLRPNLSTDCRFKETYVLTALVSVESIDWYTTLMRALGIWNE